MRRVMAIGFALGLCLAPASAHAFDTQPHADMTRDALTAEGFARPGANVGMVNNWFVDYYTNPDNNPLLGARQAPASASPGSGFSARTGSNSG